MDRQVGSAASGPAFDLHRPSASRVYDHLLGGSHNFEVDRDVARQMLRRAPGAAQAAAANREFMDRAVQYLVGQGVHQFLDIGSGLPTAGNVHQVAHRYDPASRVAYVDIDPVAVMHGRQILEGDARCVMVQGDLCKPASILDDPHVRGLLDFTEPVAVLLVGVLDFVPDEADPAGVMASLREALASGGHLVVSHASWPADATLAARQAAMAYECAAAQLVLRTPEEVAAFFAGFDLVEPGLVTATAWRPVADVPDRRGSGDDLPAVAGVGVRAGCRR